MLGDFAPGEGDLNLSGVTWTRVGLCLFVLSIHSGHTNIVDHFSGLKP